MEEVQVDILEKYSEKLKNLQGVKKVVYSFTCSGYHAGATSSLLFGSQSTFSKTSYF